MVKNTQKSHWLTIIFQWFLQVLHFLTFWTQILGFVVPQVLRFDTYHPFSSHIHDRWDLDKLQPSSTNSSSEKCLPLPGFYFNSIIRWITKTYKNSSNLISSRVPLAEKTLGPPNGAFFQSTRFVRHLIFSTFEESGVHVIQTVSGTVFPWRFKSWVGWDVEDAQDLAGEKLPRRVAGKFGKVRFPSFWSMKQSWNQPRRFLIVLLGHLLLILGVQLADHQESCPELVFTSPALFDHISHPQLQISLSHWCYLKLEQQ